MATSVVSPLRKGGASEIPILTSDSALPAGPDSAGNPKRHPSTTSNMHLIQRCHKVSQQLRRPKALAHPPAATMGKPGVLLSIHLRNERQGSGKRSHCTRPSTLRASALLFTTAPRQHSPRRPHRAIATQPGNMVWQRRAGDPCPCGGSSSSAAAALTTDGVSLGPIRAQCDSSFLVSLKPNHGRQSNRAAVDAPSSSRHPLATQAELRGSPGDQPCAPALGRGHCPE